MSKKGFTLVELLAVIVILAVIMLIGINVVGPIMTRTKINSLATEGMSLIEAAKNAYASDQMDSSPQFSNGTACLDMQYLKELGYYDKNDEDYGGSVLITPDSSGNVNYKTWISNSEYSFSNKEKDELNEENVDDYLANNTDVVGCPGKIYKTRMKSKIDKEQDDNADKIEMLDYVKTSKNEIGFFTIPTTGKYKIVMDFDELSLSGYEYTMMLSVGITYCRGTWAGLYKGYFDILNSPNPEKQSTGINYDAANRFTFSIMETAKSAYKTLIEVNGMVKEYNAANVNLVNGCEPLQSYRFGNVNATDENKLKRVGSFKIKRVQVYSLDNNVKLYDYYPAKKNDGNITTIGMYDTLNKQFLKPIGTIIE